MSSKEQGNKKFHLQIFKGKKRGSEIKDLLLQTIFKSNKVLRNYCFIFIITNLISKEKSFNRQTQEQ